MPPNLSLNNLLSFKDSRNGRSPVDHCSPPAPGGRRNIMALRESDIILAVGSDIRITSLANTGSVDMQRRSYKTLHTPNVEFEIRQITVNHNGKLLAVAGTHQVAVVSLPRAGYSKLVTSRVDCRSIHVGQFHHATNSAAPISKIEWHPWGKSGCTLIVMTSDGLFREYDVSIDPEEPQQTLSFMPERALTSSSRGDGSSRDVVSFCFGQGNADWGPLTVYALTKSGDVWAMCPFMPSNAAVPSAYIHALEYFVRAKEELATNPDPETSSYPDSFRHKPSLSTLYAYQLKYAVSLSKQLPATPSTLFPAPSRLVAIHAPSIIKARPMRQGPFLFQPAPRELEQGEGGDATDLMYMSVERVSLHADVDGNEERLGVLVVAYSDGKVDVCLDVEKIEAMWEVNKPSILEAPASELPMVAVYETIDLGLVSKLSGTVTSEPASWLGRPQTGPSNLLALLHLNHPVFASDPIYDDIVYLYHAFGVHVLNMSQWLQPLASSLRNDVAEQVEILVKEATGTEVTSIMDTFSPELRSSQPIGSVVLPSDVYLSRSLFVVTSSLKIETFRVALHLDFASPDVQPQLPHPLSSLSPSVADRIASVQASDPSMLSLLSRPYEPPYAISMAAISDVRQLAPQVPATQREEIQIAPETLRQFATTVHAFQSHIRDVHLALNGLQDRLMLQDKEFQRQQEKYVEIVARTERLRLQEQDRIKQRFELTTAEQKRLLGRSDKLLQALMDTSSPVLNEPEKRWFAELQRMKADVLGEGNYDSASLKTRTYTLANKLEYYLPNLRDLAKWEEQRRQDAARNPIALGASQQLKIMMRLGECNKMLSDVAREIEQTADWMKVELEERPSLE